MKARSTLAGATLAVLAATPAAATAPAANGEIALLRYVEGKTKLYLVDPGTRRQRPFPSSGDMHGTAAWSPDGRRIAFGRTNPDGTRTLVVTDARGRNAVVLTRHSLSRQVFDDALAWSPDGRLVAFQRTAYTEPFTNDVYVIGAHRRGLRLVARNAYTLAWSPDGRSVVFARTRRGERNPDLYVMPSAGGPVRRLTRTPVIETTPSWSPDGERIAFTRRRFDGNYDVFTMRADGSDERRLTWLAADDYGAVWSPDGRKLAFASKRVRGQFDVFLMNPDGSKQRRLTRRPENETDPDWRPLPG